MSFSVFPPVSGGGNELNYFPVTGAGTFTLETTLSAGVYLVTADTTQTFTLQFGTASGYRFSGTIRGGSGFVTVHSDSNRIVIPAGLNYPFIVGFQLTSYTLATAPTFTSFVFTGISGSNRVGTLSFVAPNYASAIGYFDRGGAFVTLPNTSSPATSQPITEAIAGGSTGQILLVARDANGIWSRPAVGTTGTATTETFRAVFTSSGTWTAPVSSIDALVVAGGGAGGSIGNTNGSGGGGGAGGMRVVTGQAVTPGTVYTITVGAGGAERQNLSGSNGGNSSIGTLIVATGGGGGGIGPNAGPGSGGSGGGGGGNGQGNFNQSGGTGISGQGFAGGNAVNTSSAAGGGGAGGVGANAGTRTGGPGVANNFATGSNVTYATGGTGDIITTTDTSAATVNTGNGGDGTQYNSSSFRARAGASGIVAIRWTL